MKFSFFVSWFLSQGSGINSGFSPKSESEIETYSSYAALKGFLSSLINSEGENLSYIKLLF